jgi:hypothetical protein
MRGSWKRRLSLVIVGVLILTFGAVIGAGAAVLYFRNVFVSEVSGAGRIGGMVTTSINERVTLSADESSRINVLIESRMDELERTNALYGKSIQAIFDDMCSDICEILGQERSHAWQDGMRRTFGERAARQIDGWRHAADCPVGES